ncbi:hypothetical protein JZ751_026831 [Albula glossodonta]|uniref:SH3 domain-containing protein n=1 Tax=Albula glossodonta TaxID=121402 RepID=A0A8T2PLD9_9TELE|nr:hypothetical protein JZ751_026831 [Albula glossodonta]
MEAIAKYDFKATADDELSFKRGEVLKRCDTLQIKFLQELRKLALRTLLPPPQLWAGVENGNHSTFGDALKILDIKTMLKRAGPAPISLPPPHPPSPSSPSCSLWLSDCGLSVTAGRVHALQSGYLRRGERGGQWTAVEGKWSP